MYIRRLSILNYGPIENLVVTPRFDSQGAPIPIVIIGKNGGGKSIVLSHIVNALIASKQMVYNDSEVEEGKVYKYRSPLYVKSGRQYFHSRVEFDEGCSVSEMQIIGEKSAIEKSPGFVKPDSDWDEMPPSEHSHFKSTFNKASAEKLHSNNCVLFFPPNRHEEPGWLNADNLVRQVEYTDKKRITGYSNRRIIADVTLKNIQRWLLDVLLDRNLLEPVYLDVQRMGIGGLPPGMQVLVGYNGPAARIYDEAIKLLRIVYQGNENLRFGIGVRGSRQISIMNGDALWVPNLFQLSSGEALVLSMFLSIIRDYDLCNKGLNGLNAISGIVVIDEIEAHLHATIQRDVLPRLLKLFPMVQFVITTHSPLFLLGMQKEYGDGGCDIINMPDGVPASVESWSEFSDHFDSILQTQALQKVIKTKIEESHKPIVFVEGDYDIRYIQKAASLLDMTDLLSRVTLENGDGYGNLDKIWTSMGSRVAKVLTRKTMLLYDCDTKKVESVNGMVVKKVIKTQSGTPIGIGIENLFPSSTIEKIESVSPQYIDVAPARIEKRRGVQVEIPMVKSINKDEKGNICAWICENGTRSDFENFAVIFAEIRSFIEN